ncbi:MAG: 16S rRNA (guanine(527)-N(7))-methyltransferase RsmG, partial [Candidatus Eisenbacteria sp.]|nr:16S rRNA (guanine(527)-N(7))-methyltransferase RsmG [Candidatus Eisenbacteria bacterium]
MVGFSLPRDSIETVGGHLSDEQAELLTVYGQAILRGSKDVNLVSRRSLGSLGEHFVDSAALLSFVDPGQGSLGDLGSGAGFPGVVVAIMRPRVSVTLVDSRRSKVVFLKNVRRRLGLDNVTVVHGRLEELRGRVQFDVATARALGSAEAALAPCLRLVAPGGKLVLFKGPLWSDEVERARGIAAQERAEIVRTEVV